MERATHRCWFVVYQDVKGLKSVSIYRPQEVFDDCRLGLAEEAFVGYNHSGVAQFVRDRLVKPST